MLKRNSGGSLIELTLILPFILLFAVTLVSLARVYYTHNLVIHTLTDTLTKVSVLFRQEFFNQGVDQTAFRNRLVQAIQRENRVSRIDLGFLNETDGIQIFFEDISGNVPADNSFDGALILYYDSDRDAFGNRILLQFDGNGAPPVEFANNCLSTTPRRFFFNPYRIRMRFNMDTRINLLGFPREFTITEESSAVLGDMTFEEICASLGTPII